MRKTVAVDLDGVLAEYHGWRGFLVIGEPIKGAQDFVAKLLTFADVVIHTSRCNSDPAFNGDEFHRAPEIISDWLKKHGFPEGLQVWSGFGKPVACAYIDDRAVLCQPQSPSSTENYEYLLAVSQARALCEEAK